ncbi:MAG: Ig-like domain-containing protein, partial [Oscillospiraceae bacterium]|nr:Ig-like domain-containing protein [Oscillospiraceae bacterium]
ISLSNSSLSLNAGESQTLTANVTPSGTAVSWSSSNTDVATVSGGRVTAVGQGTATITAQIVYNGTSYQAKCTVTVVAEVKPGISLNNNRLSLKTGESQTLMASVTPSGTSVTWRSDNSSVASVSGGNVSGVRAGTTTITATITVNGQNYSATCVVSVEEVEEDGGKPVFSGVGGYISGGKIVLYGSVSAARGLKYIEITVDDDQGDRIGFALDSVSSGFPTSSPKSYSISSLESALNNNISSRGISLDSGQCTVKVVAAAWGGNNNGTGSVVESESFTLS